jgi:hypothetical protein
MALTISAGVVGVTSLLTLCPALKTYVSVKEECIVLHKKLKQRIIYRLHQHTLQQHDETVKLFMLLKHIDQWNGFFVYGDSTRKFLSHKELNKLVTDYPIILRFSDSILIYNDRLKNYSPMSICINRELFNDTQITALTTSLVTTNHVYMSQRELDSLLVSCHLFKEKTWWMLCSFVNQVILYHICYTNTVNNVFNALNTWSDTQLKMV